MLHLELDGGGPRYEQVARALRQAILSGQLKPGTRLPPTRELAAELRLSRNTVLTAYEIVCSEQLAHSRGGSGTYVSAVSRGASGARPQVEVGPQSRYAQRLRQLAPTALRAGRGLRYDLHYGEPLLDVTLVTAWKKALGAAAGRARLHYPPAPGVRELRAAISDHVGRRRGVVCEADDVIVVHGTQQATALLARVLLNEGDPVAIEDPHYQLVAHALQAHGARLVAVRTDAEGLDPAALPGADEPAPRFVFVTPSHQFPAGVELSLTRRQALLEYAQRRSCWIVEDDYDAEFRYEPRATPALRSLDEHDRVIYVGTFSKVLFPTLRLGYMIVPRGLRDDLVQAKRLDDLGCGGIEQLAMARFMAAGGFERHLRKAAAELRRRRTALLVGLARHAPALDVVQSTAGMHVVAWLPGWTPQRLQALIAHAAGHGLGLHPIHPHYVHPPPAPGLLLGFAALSPAQLRAATALLGRCLATVTAG
jgi:GntR family transcriptional regulator/MocR family aminotransferase